MKSKIKFIQFFIVIVIFMSLSQPVLGFELNYPILPGVFGAPDINLPNNQTLVNFIFYFFIFAVITSTAIGIITIAIAGIQILIAAGNPTAISAARERIFDSILGIILLMFSVILLRTINPEFITIKKNQIEKYILRVVFAAAQDSSRPALSGVLLDKEKN